MLYLDKVPNAFRNRVKAALDADCASAECAEYERIAGVAEDAVSRYAGDDVHLVALDIWIREVAILDAAKEDAERAKRGAASAALDVFEFRKTVCGAPDCSSSSPLPSPPGWAVVTFPGNGKRVTICERCAEQRLLWPKGKPFQNNASTIRPCPHCRAQIASFATCQCIADAIRAYTEKLKEAMSQKTGDEAADRCAQSDSVSVVLPRVISEHWNDDRGARVSVIRAALGLVETGLRVQVVTCDGAILFEPTCARCSPRSPGATPSPSTPARAASSAPRCTDASGRSARSSAASSLT